MWIRSKRVDGWQLRGRDLFRDSVMLNAKQPMPICGSIGRDPDAAIDIFGHCSNAAQGAAISRRNPS
jgi:hypothetical protein